ncbi:MAG TPA: hypothetical protein VF649_06040 [Sphingomonas sp.]|jgi:hypothetical protein|uniref:hypothetical protein n=1 Tax=Sphingomonas sp. TaxID=28214 RepID=UPI002ED9AA45
MPLTTLADLDAARTRARADVHRRAIKAGAKAAEPLGIASSIWGETVTDLIADIQDIYQLTPDQKAELEPELLHGLTDLLAHYAPTAAKAGTLASVAATLRGSSLARRAAASVATRAAGRIGTRVARSGRFGASAAGAIARRAWLIPLALGGGTTALYEILGRRCINQCYDYLHARIAPAAPDQAP